MEKRTLGPRVFSLTNEPEAKRLVKRRNARERLGAHIRSFERTDPIRSRYWGLVSESDFRSETLKTAPHWIGRGGGGGGGSGGVSLQHYLFQNEIDVLSCVGNFWVLCEFFPVTLTVCYRCVECRNWIAESMWSSDPNIPSSLTGCFCS